MMIDQLRLRDILAQYKRDFAPSVWREERYKWEAVKCFQDNWDVNTPDFADMLSRSLEKTYNLLTSANNFPKAMIIGFAKSAPEDVRAMFISLYDESKDVFERISAFKTQSAVLLEKYGNGAAQHYQYENPISIYLWLRFPDRYYIYKFGEAKAVANALGASYRFKKGAYAENIRSFLSLYDALNAALREDAELARMLRAQLTDACYPDPMLKTLTVDVGFYISRAYAGQDAAHEPSREPTATASAPEAPEAPKPTEPAAAAYTKGDFLDEVYMTEQRYDRLVALVKNKMNVILQGAPGVGKTFAARRLAWSMMGEKDDTRIEFVQFHQNYAYEDFMMGYKPVEDGFVLKHGVFYRFCQKAASRPSEAFFFIIDEINRGNMSRIFGELLMLIERDYRGESATLAYGGQSFCVPKNLYIIGMMNTADRSLAMIDYALRRRFSFFEMEPGFDAEGFIRRQNALGHDTLNALIDRVRELNREIALDKSLGRGFCIGHSYFCGSEAATEEGLRAIVDYDILPMLGEYWFDEPGKLQRWANILQGVFQ